MKRITYGILFGGTFFLLLTLAFIIWAFEWSWWVLFWFIFIIFIIGMIFLVIYLFRKRDKSEDEETAKKTEFDMEQISKDALNILKTAEYAEELKDTQEKLLHVGAEGHDKTPVYHKFGTGYYTGKKIHVIINLINNVHSVLIDPYSTELNETIEKIATKPKVEETSITETYVDELGRPARRTTTKKQTPEQAEEEKEQLETEEQEEI